jgi:hypothetical protein
MSGQVLRRAQDALVLSLLIRSYRHAAAHVRKTYSGVHADGPGGWP